MSTFPATNSNEAVELVIDGGNQLHQIINEDATTEVQTESGPIPSVRKALADSFLFLDPIPWQNGSDETAFNQLRTFNDDIYWAPTATTLNPIPMGATPIGDSNWRLAPIKGRGEFEDLLRSSAVINYQNVSAMLSGEPERTVIGSKGCTGGTIWEQFSGDGTHIDHYKPLSDIDLDDFDNLTIGLTYASTKGISCFGNGSYTVTSPIYLVKNKDFNVRLNEVIWNSDTDIGNNDRLIGVINVYGNSGTTTNVISSDLAEGVSTFTVTNPSLFEKGGYAQLLGGYTDYICKVVDIQGSNITLDYSLGWDNTGQQLLLRQVDPVDNVNVTVNKFTDESGSTLPENCVSVLSFVNAANCSFSVRQAFDTFYPVLFTSNTYNCKAHRSYLNEPRDTTAGRGYLVQWNKAHKCHSYKLDGHKGRHIIDYTRAAHCTALLCSGSNFEQYPFTTHGAYEHDIIHTDCSVPVGRYGVAMANAGMEFGQQTKRFTIKGGSYDGDWLCDVYPTDVTLDNVELLGNNSVGANPSYRFGGNGHFTLNSVKMRNELASTLFRGTNDASYEKANVYINSGTVTGRYLEFNGIDGDVIIGESKVGQPFSSGGVKIDSFIITGGSLNQWGGTTLDCNSYLSTGVNTFGRGSDVRMTINCQRFIKSSGEDIQSPSFAVSGALEFNLDGFLSYAARGDVTINSYQVLSVSDCDISVNNVKLVNLNNTVQVLDVISNSSNRVDITITGSNFNGKFDIDNTTIIRSAIIKNNRFKSGQINLPTVSPTHLISDNLENA